MTMQLRHSLSKRTKDSSHPPGTEFCWPRQPCSAVWLWLFLRTGKVESSLPPDDSVIPSTGPRANHTHFNVKRNWIVLGSIYKTITGRPYKYFLGLVGFNGPSFSGSW